MSRRSLRCLLYSLAAAAALSGAAMGWVRAQSVVASLEHGIPAPPAAALLGPIDETGRTGWECKPEIAAQARAAKAAELPPAARP